MLKLSSLMFISGSQQPRQLLPFRNQMNCLLLLKRWGPKPFGHRPKDETRLAAVTALAKLPAGSAKPFVKDVVSKARRLAWRFPDRVAVILLEQEHRQIAGFVEHTVCVLIVYCWSPSKHGLS